MSCSSTNSLLSISPSRHHRRPLPRRRHRSRFQSTGVTGDSDQDVLLRPRRHQHQLLRLRLRQQRVLVRPPPQIRRPELRERRGCRLPRNGNLHQFIQFQISFVYIFLAVCLHPKTVPRLSAPSAFPHGTPDRLRGPRGNPGRLRVREGGLQHPQRHQQAQGGKGPRHIQREGDVLVRLILHTVGTTMDVHRRREFSLLTLSVGIARPLIVICTDSVLNNKGGHCTFMSTN